MGQVCSSCEPCLGSSDSAEKGTGVEDMSQVKSVVKVLEDGSTYKGETKDGVIRHGYGVYTYPDGRTFFEGHWRDGKAHGQGVFRDAESEYRGDWKDDFKHGQGQEKWFNDGSSYIGNYKYGKKEGLGKYSWADGSYYEGNFTQDNIEGEGCLAKAIPRTYFSHSCIFTGSFKDNVKHGFGRYEWADGRVYEGQFDKDLKHGEGTMTWPDGYAYKGQWKDGVQHGKGVIKGPDGSEDPCAFDRGTQIS